MIPDPKSASKEILDLADKIQLNIVDVSVNRSPEQSKKFELQKEREILVSTLPEGLTVEHVDALEKHQQNLRTASIIAFARNVFAEDMKTPESSYSRIKISFFGGEEITVVASGRHVHLDNSVGPIVSVMMSMISHHDKKGYDSFNKALSHYNSEVFKVNLSKYIDTN